MNSTKSIKKIITYYICAFVMIICLISGAFPHSAGAAEAYEMWDLKPNWARTAISYVLSKGYMAGVGANYFNPSGTVTRAQIAQVIYSRAGYPEVDLSRNVFSDVDTAKWYGRAVVWCQQNKIVSGIKPNAFAPDNPVTREQICVMVRNFYADYLGNAAEQASGSEMSVYADWPRVSVWARTAVSWARKVGFMSGTSGTTLAPAGKATREQLAQFLYSFDINVLGMEVPPNEGTSPYNISTERLAAKGKTKIIAHRGAGGIATENTPEAFTRSGVLSYYGLECDVRRTKDGEYVIFHDSNMERMAGMPGGIGDYTLAELKKVRLYETRIDKRVGEKNDRLTIPTLREYLKICKKYNKRAVIEVNSPLGTSDMYRIIDIVKSEKYLDKTIFISFELNLLVSIRNQLPNQALMLNFYSSMHLADNISRLRQYRVGCNCGAGTMTRELVQTLHRNKIEVGCWTVNDKLTAERLISYGVDYITTDILE